MDTPIRSTLSTSSAASTALHLASLLDLSARLSETDSVERILNAALLSVMGKLRIRKACVLTPDGTTYAISHGKGVAALSVPWFELPEPMPLDDVGQQGSKDLMDLGLTWAVPLISHHECVGVLAFGPTLDGVETTEESRVYVDLVRTMTAIAVHNARTLGSLVRTQRDLQTQTFMVTTLFESARDFTAAKNVDEILRILSYRLMGQLMITNFVIWLEEPLDGEQVIVNRGDAIHIQGACDALSAINEPTLTAELPESSPVRTVFEQYRIAAATPVTVHTRRMGVLGVCEKLDAKTFTREELHFIESIGNAAMIGLENDRLFREELEKHRLESEIEIAAKIQRGLLPMQLPPTPGFDVAADSRSSKQISGDYYDVITLDTYRTLFAIADVVGKGIPAAILMANVQAALNVLAQLDLSPTQIAERLNALVCENTEPDVFVTLFLAIADGRDGVITFVNAGHNPPIIVKHDGSVTELREGGVLIGVIPDPPAYRAGIVRLDVGDTLVLFTDGVTEAQRAEEEFGEHRLQESARAHRMADTLTMLNGIKHDVHAFTQTDRLHDDTSIMIIRRIQP